MPASVIKSINRFIFHKGISLSSEIQSQNRGISMINPWVGSFCFIANPGFLRCFMPGSSTANAFLFLLLVRLTPIDMRT